MRTKQRTTVVLPWLQYKCKCTCSTFSKNRGKSEKSRRKITRLQMPSFVTLCWDWDSGIDFIFHFSPQVPSHNQSQSQVPVPRSCAPIPISFPSVCLSKLFIILNFTCIYHPIVSLLSPYVRVKVVKWDSSPVTWEDWECHSLCQSWSQETWRGLGAVKIYRHLILLTERVYSID